MLAGFETISGNLLFDPPWESPILFRHPNGTQLLALSSRSANRLIHKMSGHPQHMAFEDPPTHLMYGLF